MAEIVAREPKDKNDVRAVLGLPVGVSASFSKPSVNVGEVSVLTLTVDAGAALGTYPLELEGTATI